MTAKGNQPDGRVCPIWQGALSLRESANTTSETAFLVKADSTTAHLGAVELDNNALGFAFQSNIRGSNDMKKILTISFVLACTMWMFSQTSGSQSSTQGAGDQTIVRGCLNGSGGNYTLTDQSGTTYQLTGSTAKLGDHVGHTVQITGTKTSASASTGGSRTSTTPSSAGGTNVQPTLDVTSMKHISDSCSPGK